jgi:LytR cell envelope-related transcriptional attenuator
MGPRLRALGVVVVLLLAGAFIGSFGFQWWGHGKVSVPMLPIHAGPRIRVEVLNAGGSAGAARGATDRLRDHGYDVVYFGNAASFGRDTSVVLDRTGHLDEARGVADALGIRNVRSEPDSNLYLDVSVLLGKDWTVSPDEGTEVPPAPAARKRAWWDPRRWLKR